MLKYDHASRQSQGARPYQEDACAVWPGESPLTKVLPPAPSDAAEEERGDRGS